MDHPRDRAFLLAKAEADVTHSAVADAAQSYTLPSGTQYLDFVVIG